MVSHLSLRTYVLSLLFPCLSPQCGLFEHLPSNITTVLFMDVDVVVNVSSFQSHHTVCLGMMSFLSAYTSLSSILTPDYIAVLVFYVYISFIERFDLLCGPHDGSYE